MTASRIPRETRPWTQGLRLSMLCLAAGLHGAAEPGGWNLTPLEPAPEWADLAPFQRTVTREEFQLELETVFLVPPGDALGLIQVLPGCALISLRSREPGETYRLEFGDGSREAPAFWRAAASLPPAASASRPLEGLRIAIDPGHIGGKWATMEERWFLVPDPPPPAPVAPGPNPAPGPRGCGSPPPRNRPVMEGDVVLRVAELLEAKLTALGAQVVLTRRRPEPVTPLRPQGLLDAARRSLGLENSLIPGDFPPLRIESERLFYRSAEIRARAAQINGSFRPDLVLCLHLNAAAWGDPARAELVQGNHFHILINGCFSPAELRKDDQRFLLLHRLLQRTHREELALAESMAGTMAPRLKQPAFEYRGGSARQPGANPYIWCRNLLATRIYRCPVIYFEPYVMNDELTHARIQAGDYEGTRTIHGAEYPSLYREYALAVAEGLESHYRKHRPCSRS